MPYCRKSGTWPAGEEWLFEVMNETYIPLLSTLRNLHKDNIRPRFTIGITPILAEQLADKYMKERFEDYMEDKIRRSEKDIARFLNNPKKHKLAKTWRENYTKILQTYKQDLYADILGTFKWLQEEKSIELVTSAATHGFLPLLEHDSAVYSQIHLGVTTYEKHFGVKPKGIWLPECAYRHKEWSSRKNMERRSLDEWLADEGLQYFFVENIALTQAEFIENKHKELHPSTFRGYQLESGVTVFGRNAATGRQVWDPDVGYPGIPAYQDFHSKDPESGLHYWKITGKAEKELYDPQSASLHIKEQAADFVEISNALLVDSAEHILDCPPIVMAPYDCELFGHWWHEGVSWLEQVYRNLAENSHIKPQTLSEYITENKDGFSVIRMKPSSWGENGDFSVWTNPEHSWLWPYINASVNDFELVLQNVSTSSRTLTQRDTRILRQTGRELLLMEGSDWPFLLHTQQAKDYANQRFHHHHQRFNKLLWAAKNLEEIQRISDHDLQEMEDIDNPWPDLDFTFFQSR
jgi:1,4-alpha-glucan branching enzyme